MEKAYDPQVLIEKLKEELNLRELGEEAAKKVVVAVFAWLKDSAAKSEYKYDDLLLLVLPAVEPRILTMLDKINPNG